MSQHPRRTRLVTAVLVAALSLLFVGCSSSHSSSSTTTSPGKSLTVETPDGAVSLSLDGKLPPAWPAGFPLPPGTTPAGSGSVANTQKAHMIAVFRTSSTGKDAFTFYRDSTTLTVSQVKSVGAGDSFVGRLQYSGPYSGSVTVTEAGGQTYIVVYMQTT